MSAAAMETKQRPRSKSTWSFKSDKSQNSNGHNKAHLPHLHHLQESEDEKRKSHFAPGTKANPNAAMNEAQPIAAALEKPTLQSLREFQHTDRNGVAIAEPDLSNPTRSRWERPLDTIRSFEAAIDTEYRRRASTMRAQSSADAMSGFASRRSSYYGGHEQNRYSTASGYHGGRQPAAARDSWVDNGNSYNMGGPVGPPRAQYNNRMQNDPRWNRGSNGQNVFPNHNYQQSRDTVHTNGSNGSHSDPYGTDPSSENSSIERGPPITRADMGEQYGFQGFGGNPILEEYGNGQGPPQGPPNNGYSHQQRGPANTPPPFPTKAAAIPPPPPAHGPIKLTSSQVSQPTDGNRPNVLTRNGTEKRKSWFKKRFSKE